MGIPSTIPCRVVYEILNKIVIQQTITGKSYDLSDFHYYRLMPRTIMVLRLILVLLKSACHC